MKKTFIVMLILSYSICKGQNYQCFQNGVDHYFVNSGNYLRGIRIDSTVMVGDTTIYYPFRTIRNQYVWSMRTIGGSWLGKKVLNLADGTFIFDTYWGNSIIVKTQANVGDFWIFYQDTSSRYYGATVTATDTMTVLSVLDSIKRIKIIAIDGSTITLSDPLNNTELILSKSHGFAKIFDLYMFPYHPAGSPYVHGTDYFYENCGSQIFNITDLIRPSNIQLYDFNVGDYFEFHGVEAASNYNDAYYIDSVVGKSIASPGDITYTIHRKRYIEYYGYPGWSAITFAPRTLHVTSISMLENMLMPEEKNMGDIVHYSAQDSTTGCQISPKYTFGTNPWYWDEPCGTYTRYKMGLGEIYRTECYDPYPGSGSYESFQLIYYNKNGVGCGGYYPLPVSVDDIAVPCKETGIYPNPATTELTVLSKDKITEVAIYNMVGQPVFSKQSNTENTRIDISRLLSGVYFVKINNGEVLKFVKQ